MASVLADVASKVFVRRTLTIQFLDKVLAGIPARGDSLEYWITSKHMSDADKAAFMERVKKGELSAEERAEIADTSRCVFERDAEGYLVLWHGNVKAMLREAFVCEGLTQRRPRMTKGEESAGGKQILQHEIGVTPLWLRFAKNGQPVKAPDGVLPKVKHIEDKAGKRSALGEYEYLDKPTLTFTLHWPAGWTVGKGLFTEDDLKRAMVVCEKDGLGAARSQGYGTFEVIEWKE